MDGLRVLAESNGWEVIKEDNVYRIVEKRADTHSRVIYLCGHLKVNVENIDVMDFINEVSSKSSKSIVAYSKLSGTVTGKLYRTPFDDGFKVILQSNRVSVTLLVTSYLLESE